MSNLLEFDNPARKHKTHAKSGYIIAWLTFVIVGVLVPLSKNKDIDLSYLALGGAMAFIAGWVKEIWDGWNDFPFDWGDALATGLGGVLFVILYLPMHYLLNDWWALGFTLSVFILACMFWKYKK